MEKRILRSKGWASAERTAEAMKEAIEQLSSFIATLSDEYIILKPEEEIEVWFDLLSLVKHPEGTIRRLSLASIHALLCDLEDDGELFHEPRVKNKFLQTMLAVAFEDEIPSLRCTAICILGKYGAHETIDDFLTRLAALLNESLSCTDVDWKQDMERCCVTAALGDLFQRDAFKMLQNPVLAWMMYVQLDNLYTDACAKCVLSILNAKSAINKKVAFLFMEPARRLAQSKRVSPVVRSSALAFLGKAVEGSYLKQANTLACKSYSCTMLYRGLRDFPFQSKEISNMLSLAQESSDLINVSVRQQLDRIRELIHLATVPFKLLSNGGVFSGSKGKHSIYCDLAISPDSILYIDPSPPRLPEVPFLCTTAPAVFMNPAAPPPPHVPAKLLEIHPDIVPFMALGYTPFPGDASQVLEEIPPGCEAHALIPQRPAGGGNPGRVLFSETPLGFSTLPFSRFRNDVTHWENECRAIADTWRPDAALQMEKDTATEPNRTSRVIPICSAYHNLDYQYASERDQSNIFLPESIITLWIVAPDFKAPMQRVEARVVSAKPTLGTNAIRTEEGNNTRLRIGGQISFILSADGDTGYKYGFHVTLLIVGITIDAEIYFLREKEEGQLYNIPEPAGCDFHGEAFYAPQLISPQFLLNMRTMRLHCMALPTGSSRSLQDICCQVSLTTLENDAILAVLPGLPEAAYLCLCPKEAYFPILLATLQWEYRAIPWSIWFALTSSTKVGEYVSRVLIAALLREKSKWLLLAMLIAAQKAKSQKKTN